MSSSTNTLFISGKVCGATFTFCLSSNKSSTCKLLDIFLFLTFIDGATDFFDEPHLVEVFDEGKDFFEEVLLGVRVDAIALVLFGELDRVSELNIHLK